MSDPNLQLGFGTPDLSTVPTVTPDSPLLTNLPSAQTAFTRKYSDPQLQSALSQLDPSLRASLINYDQTRVGRGQEPLSTQQTLLSLQSVISKQAATPPPDQGFFGNVVGDIQSVVSAVPQLPFQLYNEVQQLPQAPQKLSEALGRGNIQDILQGLTEVPGVRMVPGVNTLAQLANDPGQLLKHPVFTALDVLPYALPVAGALSESTFGNLPSVVAARELQPAALEAANATRESIGLQPLEAPGAVRTFLQQSPTAQAVSASRPAQLLQRTFGTMARDLSQVYQSTFHDTVQQANPDVLPTIARPELQLFRNAINDARQWSSTIPEDRLMDLTQRLATDRRTVLADPTLTDPERAFADQYIQHQDLVGNYAVQRGWLSTVDGEYLLPQEANRLLNSRTMVGRYQTMNDVRNAITTASTDAATALQALDTSNLVSEHLRIQDQFKLARGYAHVIDAAGYDSAPVMDAIRYAEKFNNDATIHDVQAAFDTTLANPTPRPLIPADEMMNQLAPYTGKLGGVGDPTIAQARAFIRTGQYQSAIERLRLVSDRSTHLIPGVDDMIDSLRRMRDQQKFLDSTSQFNDRGLAKAQSINQKLESKTVPARFVPLIEQQVEESLRQVYVNDADALKLIQQHLYSQLPDLTPDALNQLYNDVAKTWKDMKTQGYDPVFVHRVSPGAIPNISRPTIADTISTPASVRARTFDARPFVNNASVALTDQAMGYLSRLGTEQFTSTVNDLWSRPADELVERFLPQAEAAHEINPSLDVRAHLENLIRQRYTPYDPESIINGTPAKAVSIFGTDAQFVPTTIDRTMRSILHEPRNALTSTLDPIMKVFRTALIPLSPRSFMHHFVGAAVMLSAETDPSVLFRYLSQARDFVNSGEFAAVKGMPPAGFGDAPPEIVDWAKTATKSDRILAAQQTMAGQWIKSLWDKATPARDAFNNVVDKSYQLRQHMDEMYRGVAYLYGQDKALTAGLTEEQASQAGVALVRKTMQTWDRMTPIERQTIRFVFPFYGYMSLALRYAFRFPMDHPFRTAVLDNFARNEVNDFGTSLPTRFMDSLFLGHPDPKTGAVNALELGSFNPFRDVANYFTMAGFTGASNPLISSLLRAVGVDPRKGAASLYPDVTYDPVTGQLRPDNPNLLSSFIGNVIPQSQILTALIGRNDQFGQILRTNPDAAAAMLRSAAGLPNLFRSINPSQEVFKAELQRETLQDQVKNDALRTGDRSTAQQFPQLRAYFQQLSTLMGRNPQLFQRYVPTQQSTSPTETLQQGLIGMNTP